MIPNQVIYESPDGGQTVYRRETGSRTRELYLVDPSRESLKHALERNELWNKIHEAAKSDKELKNMLDQIELYHILKNSP